VTRTVAELIRSALDPDAPVQVEARGTVAGPPDGSVRLVVHDEALAQLARAPGELGFARAYVEGSLDVEGDLVALLRARSRNGALRLTRRYRAGVLRAAGLDPWRHAPAIPPEEAADTHRLGRLGPRGRLGRHARGRDRRAVEHHYDVGNAFYELLLGPSMVYSCAYFRSEDDTLESAQHDKLELVCHKLALQPGMRLLDVGCGWGSLVLHAARHHGVEAVGITLSPRQAAYARDRVAAAGLGDRIEILHADYRDLGRERFDAIASVGMVEHVGRSHLVRYFGHLHDALTPCGRLLNHQIGLGPDPGRRPGVRSARLDPDGFVQRYVFPDGELHDVGELVACLQQSGLEVRHVESLREHYTLTLRRWVANLEQNWDRAVELVGEGRARVWRLYLAGAAVNFEIGSTQVHQVLAVRSPTSGPVRGRSGFPLRPDLTLPDESPDRRRSSVRTNRTAASMG
jgi:cyclopropane-fatty-acyl-phospholipid synthase